MESTTHALGPAPCCLPKFSLILRLLCGGGAGEGEKFAAGDDTTEVVLEPAIDGGLMVSLTLLGFGGSACTGAGAAGTGTGTGTGLLETGGNRLYASGGLYLGLRTVRILSVCENFSTPCQIVSTR